MATSSAKKSSGGSPIVDTGSTAAPVAVTSSISIPTDLRARIFLVGSGVVTPSLGNGVASQELHLYGTSDTNTVEPVGSNLILSGRMILRNGSYIVLHWITGISKWVEVSRNEI